MSPWLCELPAYNRFHNTLGQVVNNHRLGLLLLCIAALRICALGAAGCTPGASLLLQLYIF